MAELQEYADRHNLEIIKEYTTLGGDYGSHHRAIARDKATGETFYLYYDRSRKRRTPE